MVATGYFVISGIKGGRLASTVQAHSAHIRYTFMPSIMFLFRDTRIYKTLQAIFLVVHCMQCTRVDVVGQEGGMY